MLTKEKESQRRTYERTLCMVMMMAMHRIDPKQLVRVEYSIGRGVLVMLHEKMPTQQDLDTLRRVMQDIIREDLPIRQGMRSAQVQRAVLAQTPLQGRLKLLNCFQPEQVPVVICDDYTDFFFGPMHASTGSVAVFDLVLQSPGFMLQLPDPHHPESPSPYVFHPKHFEVFLQSQEWCTKLRVENVADLHRMVQDGEMRPFIRVNEALQDYAVGTAARRMVEGGKRVVMIAGPSSSGKTSFANRLAIHLSVLGLTPQIISLDHYYRNREDLPILPNGQQDLEDIEALDLTLFREHLSALLRGEEIILPHFDFTIQQRVESREVVQLRKDSVLIFEGIHALNPRMAEGVADHLIARVFISALTCINVDEHNRIHATDVRLLRRMVRDCQFRNTPPEKTLENWGSVRAGEEKWIFPHEEQADFVLNTTLHYELPILRHALEKKLGSLEALPPHLQQLLSLMPPVEDELLTEIPPISILREFVGGSTLPVGS